MPDTTKMFPTDLDQETPAGTHHILADDGTEAYDLLISALAAYILGTHTETIDGAVQTVLAAIAAKYSKPSSGIPKSDLASGVQDSLDLADTALQSHQSLAGYATETWVGQQGFLTSHQDISGLQTKAITDTGGYYTTDTVEGALQEIGAEIAGVNALIGTGVIS